MQISNIKEELQRIKDELRNNVEEISESDDTLLSIASAAVSDSVGSVTNLIFDNNDPFSADPSLDNIKASILEIKNNFEVKESQIEDFQDELMRIEDDINEKEEEISGSVSRIISTATEIALSPLTYLKNQAEVLLDTMILFMMKTVIFPLLFMYLLIKGFKIIWGIDVRALIKREQKLSE
jgi:DNA repair exonuclease SbcCD ATPase subunit